MRKMWNSGSQLTLEYTLEAKPARRSSRNGDDNNFETEAYVIMIVIAVFVETTPTEKYD